MNMKFLLPNFQVYAFPACDTTGGLILPRFLHTGLDAPATTISYLYLAIPASTRVPHYLNLSAGPHKVSVLRAESISRCQKAEHCDTPNQSALGLEPNPLFRYSRISTFNSLSALRTNLLPLTQRDKVSRPAVPCILLHVTPLPSQLASTKREEIVHLRQVTRHGSRTRVNGSAATSYHTQAYLKGCQGHSPAELMIISYLISRWN